MARKIEQNESSNINTQRTMVIHLFAEIGLAAKLSVLPMRQDPAFSVLRS
jgi:hypothetical protein